MAATIEYISPQIEATKMDKSNSRRRIIIRAAITAYIYSRSAVVCVCVWREGGGFFFSLRELVW